MQRSLKTTVTASSIMLQSGSLQNTYALRYGITKLIDGAASLDVQRRQQPYVQQRNRTLKTAERGFDAEILHLLETLTPAYPYKIPPHADPDIAHLCDFMVAESYLVAVKDGYMVTATGRQHRQHLRRKPLVRWLSSNYQWFTAVAIAIASVAVATASVIVATFD